MSDLLLEGLNLMVIGMGAVGLFLVLLVYATQAMSALIQRYAPAPSVAPRPTLASQGAATPPANTRKIAAIAAAVQQHRSRQR